MLDLNELEKNLDDALAKETPESLNEFLNNQRMIPAKITNLNPVQVTYNMPMLRTSGTKKWLEEIEVIADVENAKENPLIKNEWWIRKGKYYCILSLNQQVFIELTGEGKAKIVKL